MKEESKDPRAGGRECPYCQMKQPPRVHDGDTKDNYHLCPTIGQMVPFLPVGIKNRVKRNITSESLPMMSYGETTGAYDASMGAPTRGRR